MPCHYYLLRRYAASIASSLLPPAARQRFICRAIRLRIIFRFGFIFADILRAMLLLRRRWLPTLSATRYARFRYFHTPRFMLSCFSY